MLAILFILQLEDVGERGLHRLHAKVLRGIPCNLGIVMIIQIHEISNELLKITLSNRPIHTEWKKNQSQVHYNLQDTPPGIAQGANPKGSSWRTQKHMTYILIYIPRTR